MTTISASSPEFQCVADALELGRLSDGVPGMDPELLRSLFRHACGEDGKRVLFEHDPSFTKGWVNLNSPGAIELISAFVPVDDAESLKQARRGAQANLEAQPWNDVLGIESPPIMCQVKIHGSKWGLRFRSAAPAMRGKETLNEDLPATSADSPESDRSCGLLAAHESPLVEASATRPFLQLPSATDILRAGGLPA